MTVPKISKMHQHVLAAGREGELKTLLNATTELQENNWWDEAESSYQSIRSGFQATMQDIGTLVLNFARSPAATPAINHRLKVLVDQLAIDNQRFAANLEAIHDQHKDKSGATKGYDDHRLLMQINESYSQALALMSSAAGSLIDEINELTGVKQAAVAEIEASTIAALADPNVVSDATIVESIAKNEG